MKTFKAFISENDAEKPKVHFIGFRDGDRYQRAIRIFGKPDYIHPKWDERAKHGGEYANGDIRVFATGSEEDPPSKHSWDDSQRF